VKRGGGGFHFLAWIVCFHGENWFKHVGRFLVSLWYPPNINSNFHHTPWFPFVLLSSLCCFSIIWAKLKCTLNIMPHSKLKFLTWQHFNTCNYQPSFWNWFQNCIIIYILIIKVQSYVILIIKGTWPLKYIGYSSGCWMEITNRTCLLNLIFNFFCWCNIKENKHKQHFKKNWCYWKWDEKERSWTHLKSWHSWFKKFHLEPQKKVSSIEFLVK
jgi:hypothetical protein